MKKHRSILFMTGLTLMLLLVAGLLGSLVYHVDIKPYDESQMNGALRFQAHKMLAEKGD